MVAQADKYTPPLQSREELLQKHLQAYRYALEQSAIVATTDVRGNILWANDKFSEITGYSFEELIGQNHRILKSGHHPPEFFKKMWRTIARGKVWQAEVCNINKFGKLYWVDTTIVPFMDDRGKPYQYLSIRFEITKRKLAEQKLMRQQELSQLLLEQAPLGVLLVEASGKILQASDSFLEWSGSGEELYRLGCKGLFNKQQGDQLLQLLQSPELQTNHAQGRLDLELKVQGKPGLPVQVKALAIPGKGEGQLLLQIQDLSGLTLPEQNLDDYIPFQDLEQDPLDRHAHPDQAQKAVDQLIEQHLQGELVNEAPEERPSWLCRFAGGVLGRFCFRSKRSRRER